MNTCSPLGLFLSPVRQWFQETLGEPTPPQRLGWPAIAAGQNTLILAPTGSGKTLAAFLACLDGLWRRPPERPGVRVLYVSPLKALNNDIYRNLQVPLEGVAATARKLGEALPEITVGLRTGDTPTAERQRQLRRPPHVFITTPESLHLLLTSRGSTILDGLTHVIIDEIHALCPNKRGVFLALLLERLAALNPAGFVRIGLSATQRPLDEVARYLGGCDFTADGRLEPRPVTIVDAGQRKQLDLRVVSPVEQFGPLPERSVWPSIYRLLGDSIRAHRSTIVFANNRRTVERITACLNDPEEIARAHHGSVSLEMRLQTEQALKDGRLPAVVATASLELGIDMGAVDLVCQVESPGSVARSLQRVGRAGHLVGGQSKGRLIPKTLADLLEQAVLAHEMAAGRVEEMKVPANSLDVLAQQVVAMVAVRPWDVPDLYRLVRRAYPYRDLSPEAFDAVLNMVSGRYRLDGAGGRSALAALQPRVSWDRVHNRLLPLPGSQKLALANGGTIPDTGQYAAVTPAGVRVGELDEEFIFERRVGEAFLLGTNAWRLERIDSDRVIVVPAEGQQAMVPFWRGERTARSHDLGLAIGRFLDEIAARFEQDDCLPWLEQQYFLEPPAARNLVYHVRRQLLSTGCLPTGQTIFIEAFRDQLGDWQVALLSPLGGRIHLALRLALEARLRERLGYRPQCLHHDDGLLFRFTDTDEPPLDLLEGLTAENVEQLLLDELGDSALFAIRFRQNAARALLMPRGPNGTRAPLWLQRLRGRDLLQVARRHPDFPVVAETFRECLHDHLDLPRLRELLTDVRDGRVRVVSRRAEVPSPFTSQLQFFFTFAMMYQYDDTESDSSRASTLDRGLLEQLVAPASVAHLLDPRAVHQVERRLRGIGQPPRSATEMAEWLRRLGDLAPGELEGPMAGFLDQLEAEGRAARIDLPGVAESIRWVPAEEADLYRRAFGLDGDAETDAAESVLRRFLETHALVGLADVLRRYPFDRDWAERRLEEWAASGQVARVPVGVATPQVQWSLPEHLTQVQRGSLALLRREVIPCQPPQFADFLLRWQRVHPDDRRGGASGLAEALDVLRGLPLPATLWEETVLPARVTGYQPRWLDELTAGGEWTWVCRGDGDEGAGLLAFLRREELGEMAWSLSSDRPVPDAAEPVLRALRERGALFVADVASVAGLSPSVVRSALWSLLRLGLVTNDHFDLVRKGEPPAPTDGTSEPGSRRLTFRSRPRAATSSRAPLRPEGRWSLLPWGRPDPEEAAVYQATMLLHRYGVLAREVALLDPWALPWRVLYEVLSRMEMAGTVRRGYFVEGLSGAQFASPEAAERLQDLHLPSTVAAPAVLVHSLDPANLYGSAAPFDIPLLDGGTRPLLRRPGNWLVLRGGRPVLLIEQQGKRLTALASASRDDLAAAVVLLPTLLGAGRCLLTVHDWNGEPVAAGPGRELLETAGFVRDYQGMTLYATYR